MVAEIPSMVKPQGRSPTAAQLMQDALHGHAPPSAVLVHASTARRTFQSHINSRTLPRMVSFFNGTGLARLGLRCNRWSRVNICPRDTERRSCRRRPRAALALSVLVSCAISIVIVSYMTMHRLQSSIETWIVKTAPPLTRRAGVHPASYTATFHSGDLRLAYGRLRSLHWSVRCCRS
jgi:hypothetical protein